MLNSAGCHIYHQIINSDILELLNENNNDKFIYYIFERLRRFTILPENIFLPLQYELSTLKNSYYDFYLDSTIYEMDKTWINYVRIPWFCFTPTRLIVKPFKFMRSNRVFRYIPNVSQSMSLVEFRDDTGSAYLSKELVPFLKHYLENGFWFGNRHYIYLHHAQSQVRQKQFYFYCEDKGKMTRETLESWMGNFDDEKLPAKNTARRTQPFSSTEETIEIDKKLVDIIPDLKTSDGKYNFTDGVGQISSDLNDMIHKSIGINVEKGEYVSSVLQIRYGGCKGTIAINPQLNGKKKQLLIRPSMNKFKCEHQILELCKRSLRLTRAHIHVPKARYMFGIVDEYKVLKEGQIFIQITDEDGNKTILEGPVAITKNPCHHPGDLRVFEGVNEKSLHHLYDVLVFPQQGSRPHASEISGSDLDGDEYTVIWDPKLVPTSPNPTPYEYDSGPSPKPLNRVVTRHDRLKVILDICEQDNLGRLSNIHLVLVDQLGIDSQEAISLAAGLSQELDSVKSGQHPYVSDQIKDIVNTAGTTRPDFMQISDYEVYQSQKILGKLFRSAHHLNNRFKNTFSNDNNEISLDRNLLHKGYEEYIDVAQSLYKRYQLEMLEVIGSYGFSNEIDLFCCIESCNMKANERSDIQQTAQQLLKAIFQNIRKSFNNDLISYHKVKAKAAACYYVAYTDKSGKDKRMLSFPLLFAAPLLVNYSAASEDKETNDFMKSMFDSNSKLYHYLKKQLPSLMNLLPNGKPFTCIKLLEICFESACASNDEQMINCAQTLIEILIAISHSD
ncbi:unnamed protein product [Rotaria sp. Silwood1]|nr:unnamed protein product [Rotaria sp. Silwood1]CAF1638244.1 unnamed protein product [Rotaria sp. Silwood1]CAF3760751.1 unnamed protein product [Rotaria sp. Silwood1]